MYRRLLFYSVLAAVAFPCLVTAAESEYGTSQQARAMLQRAVAAVKADKLEAIGQFNANAPPFRDRDLFVLCFNRDNGTITAHEAFVGRDIRSLRDVAGKRYGAVIYRTATEGRVSEVTFTSALPGTTKRLQKRAFVTAIGDQACGVSAYQFGSSERTD